ncbi:hypothetical protein IV102_19760 [bacterium]|nr:hypothetical protein [bacterium]
MDIRRLLLTLWQQIWLLLGLTAAALTAFLLVPELGKKVVYVSTSKILLSPSQRQGLSQDGYRGGIDSGNWLSDQQTLTELVTSERLLSRICSACNVHSGWQALRENVHLEPLSQDFARRVNMFALTVQDSSPAQAQKLTEAAVQEFVNYVEELSAREFANTRRFLEELVAEAKEKVDDTEEKLLTITSSHADAAENTVGAESLNALENDKRKLREEQAVLEAEMGSVQSYLSGQSAVVPSAVMAKPDSGLSQLESSVTAARLKLVELEQLYTQENLQVVEQRAKLEKLQQLYQTRVQQFADAVSQEKSRTLSDKRKQLESIDLRISEIRHRQLTPSEKREVAKLERQLNMWEENHLNLVKQLYQARVVEQSSRRQGAITVLENPGPGVRAKEKKSRSLASRIGLGLPFSLGLAITVVLSVEFLGASLRLVPKIETSLRVPVMAVIPPVDAELKELWEAYKREETLPTSRQCLLLDEPG